MANWDSSFDSDTDDPTGFTEAEIFAQLELSKCKYNFFLKYRKFIFLQGDSSLILYVFFSGSSAQVHVPIIGRPSDNQDPDRPKPGTSLPLVPVSPQYSEINNFDCAFSQSIDNSSFVEYDSKSDALRVSIDHSYNIGQINTDDVILKDSGLNCSVGSSSGNCSVDSPKSNDIAVIDINASLYDVQDISLGALVELGSSSTTPTVVVNDLSTNENEINQVDNMSCSDDSNHQSGDVTNKRKKGMTGINIRDQNKKLRMQGLPYNGYSRSKGKVTEGIKREGRKMGQPCSSEHCRRAVNRHCNKFSDETRSDIFQKFWRDMNWDQRKVFVLNLIEVTDKKRKVTKVLESRREASRNFFLYLKEERLQVCRSMFLSTLGIKTWTVRQWLQSSSGGGVHKSKEVLLGERQSAREKPASRCKETAYSFLRSLPVLPSHYCRKTTKKLYLEHFHTSIMSLYNLYKDHCSNISVTPVGKTQFVKIFKELNLALFSPKKDRCDVCCAYEMKQIEEADYTLHVQKKDRARAEKEGDKEKAIQNKTCHVVVMDVQAVSVCPSLNASALYYRRKLNCHNFTVYDLATHEATCYWFNETEADLSACTFASCIVHYIKKVVSENPLPIILYSDGCNYQNRNSVMSNALLHLSMELNIPLTQKFLEKGHTQMECDSVHSVIEHKLKKKQIYLPSDYVRLTQEARSKPFPYKVVELDYTFVKNYASKETMIYKSIRPGRIAGDPTVTNLRALRYDPKGTIDFKIDFDDVWQPLNVRTSKVSLPAVFPDLHRSRLSIDDSKFKHLQELKPYIPKDCHLFYDSLPHKNIA